jgi:hypothetical protein
LPPPLDSGPGTTIGFCRKSLEAPLGDVALLGGDEIMGRWKFETPGLTFGANVGTPVPFELEGAALSGAEL